MRDRAEYERAFQIVGQVIRDWDPYGLLESGAPVDEFDTEISLLVSRVPRMTSEALAAQAVSEVFSARFEPERFPPDACAEPGRELFARLASADLLVGAA
ncbi:DUF1871 family protein [Luteimonas viscosa]|uniref:DUF1871 family protein n=1 Tax=Luteimonas viscosa TaxID=1132694 RepID=A0A5D4XJK3_9GAMM|nr:DUF1871 family protein [Luteimonas viscosa]